MARQGRRRREEEYHRGAEENPASRRRAGFSEGAEVVFRRAEPSSGGVRRQISACDKASANGIPTSNGGIQTRNTFGVDDDTYDTSYDDTYDTSYHQNLLVPPHALSRDQTPSTDTYMPSLFNLQRCSLATILEDSQFQRALARHAQRCSRFAVTLVADSMDTSGLTARDSRSARARPRAGRGALVGRLPLARPQHGQVQRGLGPRTGRCDGVTLAVTLVADSMDASGLTARDS